MQMTFRFGNPAIDKRPLRRRVFRTRLEPLDDGTYLFKSKSFTRRGGRSYRLRVNPDTGYVACTCRDFKYRKLREHPTFAHGPVCKHLERAKRTVAQLLKEQAPARRAA